MDGEVLRNYLLGQLPEEQRRPIDERLLADEEFEAELLAEEDELIDDYLNDSLLSPQRKHFEEIFLIVPDRRERLLFARALHTRLVPTGPGTTPVDPTHFSMPRRIPSAIPRWAYAAALAIVAAGAIWLLSARLREAPTGHEVGASIATFNLTSLLTRDDSQISSLEVPSGTPQIRLRLELEDDAFHTYKVVLETEEGRTIRAWEQVIPQHQEGARRIEVLVDALDLGIGLHQIRLHGIERDGVLANVGRYYFRIKR